MLKYRLCLVGFGHVGQAFARLLARKEATLADQWGVSLVVTGIRTGRHGAVINPDGVDLDKAVRVMESRGSLDELSVQPAPADGMAFIRSCPADACFEISPVNHATGQPAIDYLRTALEAGMHAITANKGPVVHGFQLLTETAAAHQRHFRFESAVMDGAPIFSLFRETLPLVELRGFRGILNSCTNLILTRMEQGDAFNQAVAYAQSIGIAETDPSADVDGWDAAIKVAALITVLMGIPFTPQMVERTGIREINPGLVQQAQAQRKRWKLVCAAERSGEIVVGSVRPEMIGPESPLYSISGTSSYCQFETDVLPGLGVVENDPGPETTAYGLLADLLNVVQHGISAA